MLSTRVDIFIDLAWFYKPEDLELLNLKFPHNLTSPEFYGRNFEGAHNSREFKALMNHLRLIGMKPMSRAWARRHERKPKRLRGYFEICQLTTFSEEECAQCELVIFMPRPLVWQIDESADGEVSLALDRLWDARSGYDEPIYDNFVAGKLRSFQVSKQDAWVISDTGKQLLLSSGLTGWRVRNQLHVTGDSPDDGPDDVQCKYWKIEPTQELRYSPQMRWWLVDDQYLTLWEEGANMPDDGVHVFDRAAWENLGKPDLMAHRRILRGTPIVLHIASQKFMKFCMKHRLKANWAPTRLV